jgi:hypothetical protein
MLFCTSSSFPRPMKYFESGRRRALTSWSTITAPADLANSANSPHSFESGVLPGDA